MDDSLEALLEKATNPKNRYEDWEFIMAFCDKVNAEMEGPQVALKIIVPKIQDKNEKIALLGLALLEACVKNCGRRFHQELGKFRFLNELIRMLSPKYLGNEIPAPVQKKIKSLLYSWKVGLPSEPKIAEAFEMLKKQGLVFDESVGHDPTLETGSSKPKVALQEDPRQSEMLGKLIKSNNPEDLRAANRLIRDMVRRDEKRMEKLKKRLDELELITNNVKLLNEMLSHYKPESAAEHEKQIIEELHSSVEKMRPQLFRMASELQPSEEGMTEILQTNDSLIRVLDFYQRTVGNKKTKENKEKDKEAAISNGPQEQQSNTSTTETAATEGATNDLLLDLADLNFGNPPTPPTSLHQFSTAANVPSPNVGNDSLLLDDIGLGLPVLPAFNPTTLSSLPPLDITSTPTNQQFTPATAAQTDLTGLDLLGDLNLFSNSVPSIATGIAPTGGLPTAGIGAPTGGMSTTGIAPTGGMPTTGIAPTGGMPTTGIAPTGGIPTTGIGAPTGGIPFTGIPSFTSTSTMMPLATGGGISSFTSNTLPTILPSSTGGTTSGLPQILPVSSSNSPALGANIQPSDPFSVLDTLSSSITVNSIIPNTSQAPLPVLNKGGITVSLLFTQNSTTPNVYVMVISTISTNPFLINNYLVQAAAPKAMKVKLQPPTGSELKPYNPLTPPPNISQIMLLANPSKAPIRLRFRISYVPQGKSEIVEIAEVSFPSL